MIIRSKRIYSSNGCIDGILNVQNGKIIEIKKLENEVIDLDYGDQIIYPGLIDTHNHGNCGNDLRNTNQSDFKRKEAIQFYLHNLTNFGITGVFPTCSYDNISYVKEAMSSNNKGSKILGIHVEGPWLKRAGEKGKAASYIEPTRSIAKEMIHQAQGELKLVSVSPDIENIHQIIDVMNENNVTLALAHTNFNYEEAKEAVQKYNFKTITHLGNAMSGIHHRNVGTLGYGLLDKEIHCEFVCDFVHLCKEMVEIMLKMKDQDKLIMVSDNSHLTQLPKGKYKLLDGYVESDGNTKLITDTGKIQGSNCSLYYGFKNLVQHLNISLEEAWKYTSYNACVHYDIKNRGKLENGYYADFIILDNELNLIETYVEGNKVFDSKVDQLLYNEEFILNNKL